MEVWIEFLKHWGRSIVFSSSSSWLFVGYLFQDFSTSRLNWSSHFCLAIIVWELIVANSCIWHWHETGLQTFKGRPSSSHIGCWDLCLYQYWKIGLSDWSIEIDHLAYQWSSLSKRKIYQWRQVKWIQTGNKQGLQMIKWKKICFLLIEWQELFQFQVKLQFIWQKCHFETYIMNVLTREMHGNVQFRLWGMQ